MNAPRPRIAFLILAVIALPLTSVLAQQPPPPAEVLGFEPGDDYKMADYTQMLEYYRQLDAASDRVEITEIGASALGKPMLLLFISSEENIAQLDRWRSISAQLARARITEEEARRLAAQGKSIIWIDGGMHATERAHAQMTPLLAYKVATDESREMQNIRDNVIFLLMPVINPDGLDIVSHWYWRNLGTPFETTGPPELYHHYVGHDNNRDWYMMLQPETQAVARILYNEWYPQIVYNQHQTSPQWTRIFVPPFADPVNPNIPAGVITGVNLVGTHMVNRFSDEEKDGVISRLTFSMWWNGGMRTAPYFHNQIGILTETAHPSPTPRFYDPAERPVAGRHQAQFLIEHLGLFVFERERRESREQLVAVFQRNQQIGLVALTVFLDGGETRGRRPAAHHRGEPQPQRHHVGRALAQRRRVPDAVAEELDGVAGARPPQVICEPGHTEAVEDRGLGTQIGG